MMEKFAHKEDNQHVSFHKYHPGCPLSSESLGRFYANTMRWRWIRRPMGLFQQNTGKVVLLRLSCVDL